jgi:small subunit ribosomal protein S17
LSENEKNEEQIEEVPAVPDSTEETPVEAETSAEETPPVEAEAPAEEPEAAAEETPEPEAAVEEPEPVEEPAAEEPAAEAEPAAEESAAEEPAAETEAAVEPEAEAEAPLAPQSEPKKRRKRVPRHLRPQKTRPRRQAASGTRKPIVPEPKPEHDRGRRQERRGVVVSSAMDKTIVVKVELITSHQRYKKVIRRSVKFHAHDEQNTAKVGDVVRIVETRPLSATKRWRLAEVVEAAK